MQSDISDISSTFPLNYDSVNSQYVKAKMYMVITFLAHRWRKFTTLFHKVALKFGVCGCVCLILSHDKLEHPPTVPIR